MGEFDLSLIREFRSRPAFYDRNSPRFKDKVYTAHEWQEVSNKLGYDVSLLKDRMLQLRNRYNLEKRRLEQFREENPGRNIESPWPLYDHLHFLSGHIRSRRSFKRMLPLQGAGDDSTSAAAASALGIGAERMDSGSNPSYNHQMAAGLPFANGLVTVKMEENDSDVNESDSVQSGGAGSDNGDGSFVAPHKHPAMLAQAHLLEHSNATDAPNNNIPFVRLPPSVTPSINIRQMDTLREAKVAQKRAAAAMGNSYGATSTPIGGCAIDAGDRAHALKMRRAQCSREQKYAAFGDFLSSSLLELPAQKALLLVEKFTSELIKVLIQQTEAATAAAEAAAHAAGADSVATTSFGSCNGGGEGSVVGTACAEMVTVTLNGNGDE